VSKTLSMTSESSSVDQKIDEKVRKSVLLKNKWFRKVASAVQFGTFFRVDKNDNQNPYGLAGSLLNFQ
jgi:hypothetical protein